MKIPTPKFSVAREYASSAIDAVCSWCGQIVLIFLLEARPSVKCIIPAPVNVKTCSTPSSSTMNLAKKSATRIVSTNLTCLLIF